MPTSVATLKALEDKLDALLCAYIGAHWWYWGIERNLVLGDRTTGYIVIPQGR
jgi:predicted RNase H-like nuclease